MIDQKDRDYRLVDLPGYMTWSRKRLHEGESEALIAHLDATSSWLSPGELKSLTDEFFDELLEDLKANIERINN